MTELRNVEQDLSRFRGRILAASAVVLVCFLLLLSRLVWLQVVRHQDLDEQAEANRTAIVPIVPNRGLILDRNGIVLATNYSAYTLEITPSRLVRPLDQVVDELAQVIEIQARDKRRFKKLLEESKSIDSLPIRTKLTDEEVARFTVQRFRFPGVEIKARLFRNYPWGELASHAIGYIGRINQAEKKQMEDWPDDEQSNYRGTEYIGKLGVEQSFEQTLHGVTGVEQVETSAGGRAVRKLASTPATPGNTVRLALDIKLQKLGVDLIHDQLSHFGFGEITGIDIQGESRGLLPSTEWKRKAYKKPEQQKWYAGETISLGIGQGYNNFTMLQIANATGTVANPQGARMKPHLVKEVIDVTSREVKPVAPEQVGQLTAKPENLAIIRKALVGVNIEGTSAAAFKGAAYSSGGKTGTAQVLTIAQGAKYNAAQLDERHRDHALYMAYAPAEDPKIAIAMVVENAGFGGANSAPIARRVFDYWLMNQYPSEEDMAAVQKGQAQAPIGKPRNALEVAWPPGGVAAGAA